MYQQPNNRLAGQACIVTGANSGIGMAIAIAMGKDGANVVVNYVSHPEAADAVVQEIEGMATGAIIFVDGAMTCYPGFSTNG